MYEQYFTKFGEILFIFHHFLIKWCKIWRVLEKHLYANFAFCAKLAPVGDALSGGLKFDMRQIFGIKEKVDNS